LNPLRFVKKLQLNVDKMFAEVEEIMEQSIAKFKAKEVGAPKMIWRLRGLGNFDDKVKHSTTGHRNKNMVLQS